MNKIFALLLGVTLAAGALGVLHVQAPHVAYAVDGVDVSAGTAVSQATTPTNTNSNTSGGTGTCTSLLNMSVSGCVSWVTFTVAYFVSFIAFIFFAVETIFLHFWINMNYGIVNAPIVQLTFSIVLAFANILFVAAVIAMAVATIVRYNAYGYKQLLFKIVIAAIGVNFSLILAGTVVDFSNNLTKYLLNASVPDITDTQNSRKVFDSETGGFVYSLAAAFQPQTLLTPDGQASSTSQVIYDQLGNIGTGIGAIGAAITGMLMTAFMAIVMVIFFGVLIVAFAARYIMLTLLLGVMPVVWVAWIFPFGKSVVNKWMTKFTRWTFFAPMVMFFLYLGMKTLDVYSKLNAAADDNIKALLPLNSDPQSASAGFSKFFSSLLGPLVDNSVRFTLVAGMLFGGLYFSSKMGITATGAGAAAMQSLGKSVKRRTIDRAATGAKNYGLGQLDRLRTGGKDAKGNSALQRFGSRINTLGERSRVARLLGARSAGQALANAGTPDKKAEEERANRLKEQQKNLGVDSLKAGFGRRLAGSLTATPGQERADVELLAEKKGLGDLHKHGNEQELKDLMKRAAAGGYADTILKANPLMAQFAPPGAVKTGKKETKKDQINPYTGNKEDKEVDIMRSATKSEALFNALKAMKPDDLAEMAAKNADLFGPASGKEEDITPAQMQAVKALGTRVNKIEDPETLVRVSRTIEHIIKNKKNAESILNKALSASKDLKSGEFSDDSEGMGWTDADYKLLDPAIKALDKNTNIGAYLSGYLANKPQGQRKDGKPKTKGGARRSRTNDHELKNGPAGNTA